MPWTVFNNQGKRKYLTPSEVDSFVRMANLLPIDVKSFSLMIAYTGCRISEALALTGDSIDFEAKHVVIKCLKKRSRVVFRAVPLPPDYLKVLLRGMAADRKRGELLWPWSRMTGYRRICEIMAKAGIHGSYATPKGLRHAFGIRAIQSSVPLTLVQRWLGHADIKTTAIYTSAMGPEERELAARMWQKRSVWESRKAPSRRQARPDSRQPDDSDAKSLDQFLDSVNRGKNLLDSAFSIGNDSNVELVKDLFRSIDDPFSDLLTCSLIQFWLNRHTDFDCSSTNYSLTSKPIDQLFD